jgi:subtilisin family serine protease/PKD repeat protein
MRLLYLSICFSLCSATVVAQSIRQEVVSKKLLDKMEAEPAAFHSVHLVLGDRVNLQAIDAQLSAQRTTAEWRSEAVILALKNKAQETQAPLLSFLKNLPGFVGESVNSYWIANAIFASMNAGAIAQLSHHPAVEWIGLNGKLELEKVEQSPPPPTWAPDGREPGLAAIKAPAMWAMGYTGYGQLAFTNDTGVFPDHPAIANRYRGLYVPKEQTWFEIDSIDLLPTGNFDPYDCGSHGTHVTGTILGLNRLQNDTIGVAFNAQWIGAPILCGIGTEDNVAAFQWSLDPDADPTTADDMPDIINNSWYDPSLDTIDCFSVYVPVLEALEAAGIAVVFSAGNEGPGTMTITPPHNINLHEVNAFTVGALNGNTGSLPIADFSSRGPSHCPHPDSSVLIKPEVSAPGVSVRSCVPGGYAFFNGTSMAAPHVSGAILLLKEAFPNLTGKELKLALYHSCTDLGTPGEDNVFGMGIIDVLAAFNYLVDQGHTPVSPYVANDILLVDVQFPYFACEEKIAPVIVVENAGTAPVYSFSVFIEAGVLSDNYSWSGNLKSGQRIVWQLPPLAAPAGDYEVKISLEQPNETADERPLNNIFRSQVTVTERPAFRAEITGGIDAVCEGSAALLRGLYGGSGIAHVKWYDAPFDGSLLGEGMAFATPPLAEPATFFAEVTYTEKGGAKDFTTGDTLLYNGQGLGLVFDVELPIVLKSFKVYAAKTGARRFALLNEAGEEIIDSAKPITQTGEATITLNWQISPGKNYRLIKKLGAPLFINTSGAMFPYNFGGGVVRIHETTDSSAAAGAWNHFYDWEIAFDEPCGRTPVQVGVKPAGNMPGASFTVSKDSLNLFIETGTVQFTNTSTDVVKEFHWNFGDGSTSSDEHPSHTFTAPGVYVVSLTILASDGCSDFALDTIFVENAEVSATKSTLSSLDVADVFPNPVEDVLSVHFNLATSKNVILRLADLTGRVVGVSRHSYIREASVSMDVASLPQGVYLLSVETEQGISVWKVVKL